MPEAAAADEDRNLDTRGKNTMVSISWLSYIHRMVKNRR